MRIGLGILPFLLNAACGARVILGGLPGDGGGSPPYADAGPVPAADAGGPALDDGDSVDPCISIEQQSLAIRQRACAQCHGPGGSDDTFDYVLDDHALVTMVGPGLTMPMVIPGQPSASTFLQKVDLGLSGGQLGMPPPPSLAATFTNMSQTIVYPTSEDESILYEWILNCVGVNGSAAQAMDASYGPPPNNPDASNSVDATAAGAGDSGSVAPPVFDGGRVAVDASPPPAGLAGFAFVVDGVLQTPLTCPSENWEFNVVDAQGNHPCDPNGVCAVSDGAPGGFSSVVIVNTGQVPIAYTARGEWSIPYPPGVPTGEPNVLVGVIAPQGQLDITSVFEGGVTAILGSSEPFSAPDAGKYVGDEGTIPWPGGVAGSEGSSQMWVAQIDQRGSCIPVSELW
jgi:hypothetical protein